MSQILCPTLLQAVHRTDAEVLIYLLSFDKNDSIITMAMLLDCYRGELDTDT